MSYVHTSATGEWPQFTYVTSHVSACANMLPNWVTEDTSHSPIGWMNAAAPLNIMYMFVTEDTFQPPIGWLNAAAPLNM